QLRAYAQVYLPTPALPSPRNGCSHPRSQMERFKAVLRDWELPGIDLWAVYPAGRTATTKARTFASFVQEVCVKRSAPESRRSVCRQCSILACSGKSASYYV